MMNFFQLSKIFADHNGCIEWCKEHNLLASSVKCPRAECNALSLTKRASSRDGFEWRCSKRGCNGMASIRQNSWFSGSKLSIEKILALTYAWAYKFDPDTGAHTQGIENTWWEVKRSLSRTGTSKELFDGYLQEFMWRQQYGEDPFGNIIKHIPDLYEVRKDP